MESLTPVWIKRVVDFATPWGDMVSTGNYHILTTGLISADVSGAPGTVPATAIHGPFSTTMNGGADVMELVGYFTAGSTETGTPTSCSLAINVWGETSGAQSHKVNILGATATSTTTIDAGLNVNAFSRVTAGLTQLAVQGSYNVLGTVSLGKTTKGGPLTTPVIESFPFIADGTAITTGDVTQCSAWIMGPGVDADANAVVTGSPISLRPFVRVWLVARIILGLSGGTVTAPVIGTGGLSLVGYRSVKRTDPIEHNVPGVVPQIVVG